MTEPSRYEFTTDWFTSRVPRWQELLRTFVGQPIRAVEIGSYEGRSACWLLDHVLTNPSASLTCIDPWPWPEVERRFDRNIAATGRSDQVRKVKAPSRRALTWLGERSFEFAYVDGSHEAADVLLDGLLVLMLMKAGAVVIFDDYLWPEPENRYLPPKPGIDAFLAVHAGRLEVIEQGWQIAVRVKECQDAASPR